VGTSSNHSNGTGSGTVLESTRSYSWVTVGKRFNEGTLAGNYSEIGIFTANNNTSAVALSLILDGSGNPTTITVLADEILDVVYTRRLYVERGDWTGSILVGATNYNYTARWSSLPNAGLPSLGISGVRVQPYRTVTNFRDDTAGITGGNAGSAFSVSTSPYVPGTFVSDSSGTSTVGGVTDGVLAVLAAPHTGSASQAGPTAKYLFDNLIPVSASQRIAFQWRLSWGRYTP
jgi:hypothetical protein